MQLTPRYLVNERIFLISNDAGFTVEYRPVYTRTIKVFRGIDNTLQFRLLNADQKPVTITGIPVFVAFDDDKNQVLNKFCTVTDDGSTKESRGMFQVSITENELLNVEQQYLSYNVYIEDDNMQRSLTYANRNFEGAGIIYVDGNAFPGPKQSIEINTFNYIGDKWYAGSTDTTKISAYPGLNGNEALHTVVFYSNGYQGTINIQATLENQITDLNNWATLATLEFTGLETDPVPINLNGVFSFLRFEFDQDPTDKITKLLIRN